MDRGPVIRPLLVWTTAALIAALAVAAASSVAVHLWGAHRLEAARAGFDERWGDLARVSPASPVPEHLNGARWLTAGGQAIICSTDDQRFIAELSARPPRTWSDAETATARRILHDQRAALTILLRAGVLDSFDLGIDDRPASYEEIDFLSLVKGLRLLTLEARLAWAEGRMDDSLAAFNAVGRSADGLLRTPVVMTLTLGAAAQRWAAAAAKDLVQDPCATAAVLDALRNRLPVESAVHRGNRTMAVSIAEVADEGLRYIEDIHDPSMGWSIPFWVLNRFLFEELLVADILDRWVRHLELGQVPAAAWADDAAHDIWDAPAWSQTLALTGTFTPSLGAVWVRVQAAKTELDQVTLALDLLCASAGRPRPDSCDLVTPGPLVPLTGNPVVCRWDAARGAIVIEVPDAEAVLVRHSARDNDSARLQEIVLSVAPPDEGCR